MRELFCNAAPFWVWTWVCVCIPRGPIWLGKLWFSWVCKFIKTDGFTWPCPRPWPSPFYPSGMPISASLSSAPATHNMAPERGQKGGIWKHFLKTSKYLLIISECLRECTCKTHFIILYLQTHLNRDNAQNTSCSNANLRGCDATIG